ncbi:MAG TPA: hypothetical protein VFM90_10455 [Cyclobacteriaceae bacterium]|nr:hypothetical protein [Cyclobacteriaceae bacterium]
MKKIISLHIILFALLLIPFAATSTRMNRAGEKIYIRNSRLVVLDVLTVYHPVKKQCDDTPLITASNSKIDRDALRKQNIRWMALSRDLLKRWNGAFHYGDTVLVTAGDPQIDGLWIIKDTMNKRFKNRGDLLFDREVRKLGRWENVEVSAVQWLTL